VWKNERKIRYTNRSAHFVIDQSSIAIRSQETLLTLLILILRNNYAICYPRYVNISLVIEYYFSYFILSSISVKNTAKLADQFFSISWRFYHVKSLIDYCRIAEIALRLCEIILQKSSRFNRLLADTPRYLLWNWTRNDRVSRRPSSMRSRSRSENFGDLIWLCSEPGFARRYHRMYQLATDTGQEYRLEEGCNFPRAAFPFAYNSAFEKNLTSGLLWKVGLLMHFQMMHNKKKKSAANLNRIRLEDR